MSEESTPGFDALEKQFGSVALALREGDATQLEALSSQLQQMTVDFARTMRDFPSTSATSFTQLRRVKALGQGFQVLRESLLRRQALVDHALQVVVPATRSATYSSSSAGHYGAGPKASGEFQSFLA
ncbi:MAG: hypothetical protein U5M53_05815 [Rhodoferax sp.]|nr:hypothetical protein [Rhodoferax sp.]